MSRYQQLVNMSFFGPASRQIARAREVFSWRLQTSVTSRWSIAICIKIFDAMFDDVRPCEANFAMFRRWFKQFDEMRNASSYRLTSSEAPSQLSGNLEIALLALRAANSMDPYQFLTTHAPTFLQIAFSNPTLWAPSRDSTSIPIAHIFASTQYELSHFVLPDLLCSLAYGLPQVVEYDTTVAPLKSDAHPTQWVHGCPLALKIMLADINKHVTQGHAGPILDWRSLEQQLWSWKPSVYTIPNEESWRVIARLAVQESWRHTLLIYLYMGVCGLASDDVRVASSIRQVFQIMDTVKHRLQPITKAHFLMQCLIAGACTPNERQRALARARLSDSVETMIWLFPVSNFVPVLDHLWHGVAADGRPIRWSDYLYSRQTVLPISHYEDSVLPG
ncbi:hypothetical protein FS749_003230 [Ceratobasidium sp. UAMH 11750]|nr:hypothetical protein FS749_003230 [Ceratobasidium sp. UAMH 11750]